MKDEPASSIRQQPHRIRRPCKGRRVLVTLGDIADPAAGRTAPEVAVDLTARPVSAVPMEPLDIRALLHPTEHSRLLIALSSSAVVFGVAAMIAYAINGWTFLAFVAVALAVFGGLVWLSLQVYRSRLLGGAVRVSEATLQELQSLFDEVRARLHYQVLVDVHVMDKVDGGSAMISYPGTRLIQIDGGLVAELLGEEHHAELTYLIGRHIGQLKARNQRLLPRLAQLCMSEPHATIRYLNLLVFFARTSPQEVRTWQASLDEATAARPAAVIEASPDRRAPRRRPNPMSTLAATLVTGGLLALSGWVIFGGLGGQATAASQQLLARVPTSSPRVARQSLCPQ